MQNLPSENLIPHLQSRSCADVLKKSRSNFMRALFFTPKKQRHALRKIYAFCRIIDDCADEPLSVELKKQALRFWQTEVLKVYRHEPGHPVLMDLKPVITHYAIPREYLLGLITGCEMDTVKCRYQSFAELHEYCYHVAGLVGLACLKIFEYHSPTAEKMAADLGLAFQLTNILRDLKTDLQMGRIYLPLNDIKKFGLSEDDLKTQSESEKFHELMNYFAQKAINHYQAAFEEFKHDRQNKLLPAKIMACFYVSLLKKIIHQNFPVLKKHVSLNFMEKTRLSALILCRKFDSVLSL